METSVALLFNDPRCTIFHSTALFDDMEIHLPRVYIEIRTVFSSNVPLKIDVNNDNGRFDDSSTNHIGLSMSTRLAHVVTKYCPVGTVIILYDPLPLGLLWVKERISFSTVDFVFCKYSPNSNRKTLCRYTLTSKPISFHSSHILQTNYVDIYVPNSLKN